MYNLLLLIKQSQVLETNCIIFSIFATFLLVEDNAMAQPPKYGQLLYVRVVYNFLLLPLNC